MAGYKSSACGFKGAKDDNIPALGGRRHLEDVGSLCIGDLAFQTSLLPTVHWPGLVLNLSKGGGVLYGRGEKAFIGHSMTGSDFRMLQIFNTKEASVLQPSGLNDSISRNQKMKKTL